MTTTSLLYHSNECLSSLRSHDSAITSEQLPDGFCFRHYQCGCVRQKRSDQKKHHVVPCFFSPQKKENAFLQSEWRGGFQGRRMKSRWRAPILVPHCAADLGHCEDRPRRPDFASRMHVSAPQDVACPRTFTWSAGKKEISHPAWRWKIVRPWAFRSSSQETSVGFIFRFQL